ncbi:hypothetical protein BDQ17DRAFT_1324551 [Cyathus striatus]|nr:hypothetical protein BDQ17DRAFT_1324551 [Cyathus striatus]
MVDESKISPVRMRVVAGIVWDVVLGVFNTEDGMRVVLGNPKPSDTYEDDVCTEEEAVKLEDIALVVDVAEGKNEVSEKEEVVVELNISDEGIEDDEEEIIAVAEELPDERNDDKDEVKSELVVGSEEGSVSEALVGVAVGNHWDDVWVDWMKALQRMGRI